MVASRRCCGAPLRSQIMADAELFERINPDDKCVSLSAGLSILKGGSSEAAARRALMSAGSLLGVETSTASKATLTRRYPLSVVLLHAITELARKVRQRKKDAKGMSLDNLPTTLWAITLLCRRIEPYPLAHDFCAELSLVLRDTVVPAATQSGPAFWGILSSLHDLGEQRVRRVPCEGRARLPETMMPVTPCRWPLGVEHHAQVPAIAHILGSP
jgi:hypothetical protein